PLVVEYHWNAEELHPIQDSTLSFGGVTRIAHAITSAANVGFSPSVPLFAGMWRFQMGILNLILIICHIAYTLSYAFVAAFPFLSILLGFPIYMFFKDKFIYFVIDYFTLAGDLFFNSLLAMLISIVLSACFALANRSVSPLNAISRRVALL